MPGWSRPIIALDPALGLSTDPADYGGATLDFGDQGWGRLVEEFISSLSRLRLAAGAVVELTSAQIDELGPRSELGNRADEHLENSQAIGSFLDEQRDDPVAQQLLGRVASVDFDVAQLLDAAYAEPDVSRYLFVNLSQGFDIERIEADLLGFGSIRGAQADPAPLRTVRKACNEVIDSANERAKHLVRGVAASLSVNAVVNGLGRVTDGTFVTAIGDLQAGLRWLRQKVLNFIQEGIAKIAKLFGVNPKVAQKTISQELSDLWNDIFQWFADVLGRSGAMSRWEVWLGTAPGPDPALITAALATVAIAEGQAKNQLQWADRTITGFGWISAWLGKLHPAGPAVLATVAAALGGWVIWASWRFLNETRAAAH